MDLNIPASSVSEKKCLQIGPDVGFIVGCWFLQRIYRGAGKDLLHS